jgi:hypothetical protein
MIDANSTVVVQSDTANREISEAPSGGLLVQHEGTPIIETAIQDPNQQGQLHVPMVAPMFQSNPQMVEN